MDVRTAIRQAEELLPGEPVGEGPDPRWEAIIAVGDCVESEPDDLWAFVHKWGGHPDQDLRSAIATCLLEHLLEYHFELIFPRVEETTISDELFADTFLQCWKFGQSEQAVNSARFDSLRNQLRENARAIGTP